MSLDSGYTAKTYIEQGRQSFYGDVSQLRQQVYSDEENALREVAQQFESMFMGLVLKSMREASNVFKSDLFSSNSTEFYEDMFDSQLAMHLGKNGSMGLTDALMSQLKGQIPNNNNTQDLNAIINTTNNSTISPYKIQDENNYNNEKVNLDEELNMFSSPESFLSHLKPIAMSVAKKTGFSAPLMLAQAALETGWGKKIIKNISGDSSNNLFGIKAQSGYDGDKANVSTLEYRNGVPIREKHWFRSYNSLSQSFDDFANFLNSQPRYENAIQHKDNPEKFINEIAKAGYATDPNYAEKIMAIYNSDRFQKFFGRE